jgi:hypothetical protein
MPKQEEYDPKKLLRCPNGCGLTADFTALVKCCVCGKVLCGVCRKPIHNKPYCKGCHRKRILELNARR